MGIKHAPCKTIFLAITLLFSLPAAAQVPELLPLNYKGKYEVVWNGLGIGRIRVEIREDAFSYSITTDTKTSGVARMFSKEKSLAKASGRIRDGAYFPTRYESKNVRSKGEQRTLMTYDEQSDIKTYEREPKDNPSWRPEVPRSEANSAYDPMTGFLVARHKLRDAMSKNQKNVSVRTYDGARLATLGVEVVSPARIEKLGEYVKAINTVVTRQPINGYTPKEWKKFKEGDPPIHLYLSADADMLPLQISIGLSFGTLAVRLVEYEALP